jgi:hypothetical protein
MLRFLTIPVFIFYTLSSSAQESSTVIQTTGSIITPAEKTIYFKLAADIIPLKIHQYGDKSDFVFINLHDDEFTSVDAVKKILETTGGLLIEVENKLQRNLRFRIGKYVYKVDPNRIFSEEGIKTSMDQLGFASARAVAEVKKLGQRILQLIPGDARCVVALHNNTPDLFTIQEYAAGNKRSKDSKKVFINSQEDADDFFLTTDTGLYEQLANKGFNTILQDNKNCTEDGSLSVYCGKNKIRYVNCETEHGKSDQYYKMIQALLSVLSAEQ